MNVPTERASGWGRGVRLAGDASSRTYSRLWDGAGRSAIVADYPPEWRTELDRDLEVTAWLAARGIRVPATIEVDRKAGRVVVEDFGHRDAAALLAATPVDQRLALALRLIAPLEVLAAIDPLDLPPWNRPLDRNRLRWELAGCELWFVRDCCGARPSPVLERWLDALADEVADHPVRVCHRDYHANNLFFLEGDAVGVIDAQDLLLGPDTYDAVSFLWERAAASLLRPAEQARWLAEWAERTRPGKGWPTRWPLVRIQRGLKVLGTFARLLAGGRGGYRRWLVTQAAELRGWVAELDGPGELIALLEHATRGG